ncbi:hypothetical protein, partial [Erythrobacter sp. YJ-T3-07]|uniref:hypothetical protein n=1 Tax=Erythrobacter sp. YJ-T3-07 TaxID=2793063 RepID=UPI001F39F60C
MDDLMCDIGLLKPILRRSHEERASPASCTGIPPRSWPPEPRSEQPSEQYETRSNRRRFTPGILQTIGDDIMVESYDESHMKPLGSQTDNNHQRSG